MEPELICDFPQRQRTHCQIAVFKEVTLTGDDRFSHTLYREKALLEIADQPARFLQMLREFIAAEDRRNPLSDVQLTELLANRGVKVARRTVTKYRRSMLLPAVDFRRA